MSFLGNSHHVHPSTRRWLLDRIDHWLNVPPDSSGTRFYPILGRQRTGKTALAAAVCKVFSPDVAAAYFFDSAGASPNGLCRLLRGVASGLLQTQPEYLDYLDDKFGGDAAVATRLQTGLNAANWQTVYDQLIRDPLQSLYGAGSCVRSAAGWYDCSTQGIKSVR